jgi:hypothetical protein
MSTIAGLELSWLLREHHASFQQKSPYLVNDRCTPGYQSVANAMDRLQV